MSTQAAPNAGDVTPDVGAQIEQLTRQAVVPTELANGLYAGIDALGHVHVTDVLAELEARGAHPTRKTGERALHDPDSFVAYVNKHGIDGTEVYADRFRLAVTAIIDGDTATEAGWLDHRAVFKVRETPAWLAWKVNDNKWLTQLDMAEHVEDRLPDFIEPLGADMLEIAQTFKASRSGAFESSQRLGSGSTSLVYRDQVDATAQNAAKQTIAIPDTFKVQLAPFEGATVAYSVGARFRYRIREGKLSLLYKLDRPEDVVREAFEDVVATIDNRISPPVWSGSLL